ncbi:MAG: hypothetical protein CBC23_009270 [Rhodospirillaceae bacterium TMED63]|nr:MAG: hypothetical protein CBC23_009270 [Rhodospirillaceae bacterium TMED63]
MTAKDPKVVVSSVCSHQRYSADDDHIGNSVVAKYPSWHFDFLFNWIVHSVSQINSPAGLEHDFFSAASLLYSKLT